MSPWVWAPWLPWALLLIHVPGCLSLKCPSYVDGTVGGSLSVQCTYKQEYQNNRKYWCTAPCWKPLRKIVIVQTSETQREARTGRTTIRDEPANLTFTVTLENLMEADAGTYDCGVSRPIYKFDPLVTVVVSVSPAPKPTLHTYDTPRTTKRTFVLSTTLAAGNISHSIHVQNGSQPAPSAGSLLSSVHFRLLIFLKVPLLLGMMGAVLWVSWPRRGPVTGRQRRVTTRGPV